MILTTTASAITVVATAMTTMTVMGMMTATTMATAEGTHLDPVGVDVVDHPLPHL